MVDALASEQHVYGGATPGTMTQFRQAEKEYQRSVKEIFKQRRDGKKRFDKVVEKRVDLTHVVDVDRLDSSFGSSSSTTTQWGHIEQHGARGSIFLPDNARVYSFSRHPGFYIIRRAIPESLIGRMAHDCFTSLVQPPGTTNFNKSHGVKLARVWEAAHDDDMNLVETQDTDCITEWSRNGTGPSAQHFLDNLRWASIGPVYDWTTRRYRVDDAYIPLPDYMAEFSKNIVSVVHALSPDCQQSFAFHPNAALINYYREGDKLCGHRDDAESDQTKPLVSCSLGCPAIFLMGGCDKSMCPTPILLRHGDVAVLSGQARVAYHGVPRIFPEVRKLSVLEDVSPEMEEPYPRDCLVGLEDHPDIKAYLENCRINVSIREVS
ncbi:hypothetical protein M9435_003320 [Picochlorum sp. BPE23]|nr:hypothetical protein M9435_003320 [Picochlorum sp. BPE23]